MSREYLDECPCGSGKPATVAYDARGIPLGYTCKKCHDGKMKKYRPEVLTNPNYECDEDIYGEEDY